MRENIILAVIITALVALCIVTHKPNPWIEVKGKSVITGEIRTCKTKLRENHIVGDTIHVITPKWERDICVIVEMQ